MSTPKCRRAFPLLATLFGPKAAWLAWVKSESTSPIPANMTRPRFGFTTLPERIMLCKHRHLHTWPSYPGCCYLFSVLCTRCGASNSCSSCVIEVHNFFIKHTHIQGGVGCPAITCPLSFVFCIFMLFLHQTTPNPRPISWAPTTCPAVRDNVLSMPFKEQPRHR